MNISGPFEELIDQFIMVGERNISALFNFSNIAQYLTTYHVIICLIQSLRPSDSIKVLPSSFEQTIVISEDGQSSNEGFAELSKYWNFKV